ncbi:MAG: hypothetical protein HUU37_09300 [Bdellovibrionales bacterium]|nr:hypothetical protein [Bdellovibrionales bacterium]
MNSLRLQLLVLLALAAPLRAWSADVFSDFCVIQSDNYDELHNVTDYLNQSDLYIGEIVGALDSADLLETRLMAIGILVISDSWGERLALLERSAYPSQTAAILERAAHGARWIAIRRGCVPRPVRPDSLDGRDILRLSLEKFGAPAPLRMFEWR